MPPDITCPRCGSKAYNRYGKSSNGKTRYICLICNRQFVAGSQRKPPAKRPDCPECGKPMHVYMKYDKGTVRFRCSDYPACRTFVKIQMEKG